MARAHAGERRARSRPQDTKGVFGEVDRAGDVDHRYLMVVKERVDDGRLSVEGDPPFRARMRRDLVEWVVLGRGKADGRRGQPERGVVGHDEHLTVIRRSNRKAERGSDDLVVRRVGLQAVLVQQAGLDAVDLHAHGATEWPVQRLAQVATGVEPQLLDSAQDVAGGRACRVEALLQPVEFWTTVSGTTMFAPGNASKMPSGSDIIAEVSRTTVWAVWVMTTSRVTPESDSGCAPILDSSGPATSMSVRIW